MSEIIRWGILGAAKFARQYMGPAIHGARGGLLDAIATRDADKALPFSDFAPGLRVFTDYEEMLADPDIDAVYIPLPNHLHVEWTRKAVTAGKHVLCEKPIALQAGEIDELIKLRDQSGLLVAEGYMILHHPQWQQAKALYESGAIGNLVLVDSVFSYDNRVDSGNIRNRSDTGGGGIRDIGVYSYGSARFVTAEEPVSILSADIRSENQVDVYAQVVAEFPSFRLSAVNSMRMFSRQEVNFHGESGIIRLSAPFNPGVYGEGRIDLAKTGHEMETWRYPTVNQYIVQVENFNQNVKTPEKYACPLEFVRGTQVMIDMVFEKYKHN